MSDKRKICIVITARPSYSRIRTVVEAVSCHPKLELQLVVAASALSDRYGNTIKVIEKDGFKVDAKVYNLLDGEDFISMVKTTGLGIMEMASVFDKLQPDAVVTVADRFETMSTAIAAAYMNIPLVHVQGGEVTGNIDEKVRHSITKLADIHFVASQSSYERVVKMGENKNKVFNTGCPSIDIALKVKEKADKINFNPFEKYKGVGKEFDYNKDYLVVLEHPVTTEHDKSRVHIEITLNAVKEIGMPVFWFWPNVDAGADGTSKGIRVFREANPDLPIYFLKSMEPSDFLVLLMKSKCLIGNSSVGIRECSFLSVPVVNIGSRQKGRDRGSNVIDVVHDKNEIIGAIKKQLEKKSIPSEHVYGDGQSGQRIADLLAEVEFSFDKKISY